jgi:hypothetical protein
MFDHSFTTYCPRLPSVHFRGIGEQLHIHNRVPTPVGPISVFQLPKLPFQLLVIRYFFSRSSALPCDQSLLDGFIAPKILSFAKEIQL